MYGYCADVERRACLVQLSLLCACAGCQALCCRAQAGALRIRLQRVHLRCVRVL